MADVLRDLLRRLSKASRDAGRIDIARDRDGHVDDVVVHHVRMFRAERMSKNTWWVACYLDDTDERITWNVSHTNGRLHFSLGEFPERWSDRG